MTRRTFAMAGTAASAAQTTRTARVNLLMIMADQHRGDCLGCEGHPAVKTPNLDRLASEGARFRHAYSSTPTCTPARAGLLTGLSPWNHGMLGYGRVATKYPFTKPQALRDAGYHTLAIGKNHFSPQRNLHGYHETILDESGRAESPEFRSDYRAWFRSQAPTLNPDETGVRWNDYRAMTGDHNLWRKSYAYEASARIPMIMRWPNGLISARRGQVREEPVELRDILPTLLDAAGAQTRAQLDGESLLRCVARNGQGWRDAIDLEHDTCYDRVNHWSALTDGRSKYIYHALDGEEQLFDLQNDPNELENLAGSVPHEVELKRWRGKAVAMLAERGERFVKGGRLVPRPERYLYSPNYPRVAG